MAGGNSDPRVPVLGESPMSTVALDMKDSCERSSPFLQTPTAGCEVGSCMTNFVETRWKDQSKVFVGSHY